MELSQTISSKLVSNTKIYFDYEAQTSFRSPRTSGGPNSKTNSVFLNKNEK